MCLLYICDYPLLTLFPKFISLKGLLEHSRLKCHIVSLVEQVVHWPTYICNKVASPTIDDGSSNFATSYSGSYAGFH